MGNATSYAISPPQTRDWTRQSAVSLCAEQVLASQMCWSALHVLCKGQMYGLVYSPEERVLRLC